MLARFSIRIDDLDSQIMKTVVSLMRSPWAKALLFVGALALVPPLAGCGNSNPNEREFLNSAPPGKPPENPNESVSERRARTQSKLPDKMTPKSASKR
jgi:hypothetical protein